MSEKLKSRKFWNALMGEVVGIIILCAGIETAEKVAVIAGACITIACVLGYLKTEGDIDKARIQKG